MFKGRKNLGLSPNGYKVFFTLTRRRLQLKITLDSSIHGSIQTRLFEMIFNFDFKDQKGINDSKLIHFVSEKYYELLCYENFPISGFNKICVTNFQKGCKTPFQN